MKRSFPLAAAAMCAFALAAPASAGTPQDVSVEDNVFDPDVTNQTVNGGGVRWNWKTNNTLPHNVRQDDKLFYSGPAVPAAPQFTRDPSAGTFHYYCEVHGSAASGMDAKLKVKPLRFASGDPAEQFGVRWAQATHDTGDQFDVRYRVGGGDWKVWRRNTQKDFGVFGKGDRPVDVKPGKTYSIQARSEESSDPAKRSGWSPSLKVG